MGVKEIKSLDEFKTITNSGKLVVIQFQAYWNGPSRMILPEFHKFSDNERFGGVEFYTVDIDNQSDVSHEVGIKSIPTFMLFKDGEKVDEMLGAYAPKLQALLMKATE